MTAANPKPSRATAIVNLRSMGASQSLGDFTDVAGALHQQDVAIRNDARQLPKRFVRLLANTGGGAPAAWMLRHSAAPSAPVYGCLAGWVHLHQDEPIDLRKNPHKGVIEFPVRLNRCG